MPHRPPRICDHPGCSVLVTGARQCPRHKRIAKPRPAWPHTRTAAQRGYGSTWAKLRAEILKRDPTCTACGAAESKMVDHVRPKSQGGTDDRGNLRGVCGPCHDAKTKKEAAAGTRRASRSNQRRK